MKRDPEPFDYAAEWARISRAQGLPVEIPQHQRDAVAALLATADADMMLGDDNAA